MTKKINKCFMYMMCMILLCINIEINYASIEASSGYVSKAEFDLAFADIESRIASVKRNVKIEEVVDSYILANYYKKLEMDVLLGNKQNNVLNIPGSAGQVLKRNAANNGLEFGNVGGDYYEKIEVDTMLGNKQNKLLDITGSANQYLKRNSSNSSLEFGDIGDDYYKKSEVDALMDGKQDKLLDITGSANQYLKRNSSNNGLEFASLKSAYLHNVHLQLDNLGRVGITVQFINDKSAAYTSFSSFVSDVYSQGFTTSTKGLMCNGARGASQPLVFMICWAADSSTLKAETYNDASTIASSYAISDKVLQIK